MLFGARFELGGEARRRRARTRRRRRWSVVYLPMTTVRTAVICRYDVTIESPATTNLLGGKTAPQLFNWRARWGSLSCCSKRFFYYKLAGRQMVNVNQILLAVSAPRK